MKKTLTIKVTQKHILDGKPGSSTFCPVALAVKDMGYKFVSVGPVGVGADKVWYHPTKKLCRFVNRFDAGKTVKPTSITVKYASGCDE